MSRITIHLLDIIPQAQNQIPSLATYDKYHWSTRSGHFRIGGPDTVSPTIVKR